MALVPSSLFYLLFSSAAHAAVSRVRAFAESQPLQRVLVRQPGEALVFLRQPDRLARVRPRKYVTVLRTCPFFVESNA